jgi:hypothetical protein
LEPLIRSIELDKEEPVAVVLIDQSASILAREDGSDEEQDLNGWFQVLGSELEAKGLRTEWHGFDQGLNENILESKHSSQMGRCTDQSFSGHLRTQ